MVSSTWPSACGLAVAYSMNSMPSRPSGLSPSTICSRSGLGVNRLAAVMVVFLSDESQPLCRYPTP
ncbi:MAG: hypothetical protein ACD_23C00062G0001, partial [uncultured bacterium]